MLIWTFRFGSIAATAAMLVSAGAQPITETQAVRAIQSANALSNQIRSFHRGPKAWKGYTPPPLAIVAP
jgi:hypothetical protein